MRISELSRASGVAIPTIKFYLREGLLPPGERSAPNQATYGELHLRRLRLVRILVDIGGMRTAAVRDVLGALAREGTSLHEALAAAHTALHEPGRDPDSGEAAARSETDRWLEARGWNVSESAPGRQELAATLAALRTLGWQVGPEIFERYARAADAVAAEEIEFIADSPDREAAVEATVVGTVLFERALASLRRLAQEHHSAARLAGADSRRASPRGRDEAP